MFVRLSAVAACAAVLATAAHAADIYRWVDDKGETHIADTVPPAYRNRATRIDTSGADVSAADRAAAEARLAKDKALLEGAAKPGPAAAGDAGELAPAHKPGASGLDDQRAQCDEWRRDYAQSQSCFSSYGTASGAVRAEAYQHCTVVPDPAPTCGAPTN